MIIYFAGSSFEAIEGTDKMFVSALAKRQDVLWVDPVLSLTKAVGARSTQGLKSTAVTTVNSQLRRLTVLGPPGVGRPIFRSIARRLVDRGVCAAVTAMNSVVTTVIIANPEIWWRNQFELAVRILYLTDDWAAGAAMMDIPVRRINRTLRHNLAGSQIVAAVTPRLLEKYSGTMKPGQIRLLIPNGCDQLSFQFPQERPEDLPPGPIAGVVGQINERIDLGIMEKTAASAPGCVVLIGPRSERDPAFKQRLDQFLARQNVHWLGPKPKKDIPAYVQHFTVGLTPYAINDFNMSSFPLKTLEYLSAGRPVVASDLPAVRSLETDLIDIAESADLFAIMVKKNMLALDHGALRDARQEFARSHSWSDRVDRLMTAISTMVD